MSQLNKSNIPIAVESHSKLDLPFDHASTSMFMLLQPMYYKHTLKTENNHFDFTSVVRPNPIVVPTFGRIRQNLRHFFVPYRLVFPNWHEYDESVITSNYSNSGQVQGPPYFTPDDLINLFFVNGVGDLSVVGNVNYYDFIGPGGTYYYLTRKGRNFYKILYSLGYEILPPSKFNDFKFNALALLAYARIYLDWYANSQYLNSVLTLALEKLFKFNDPLSSLHLTHTELSQILTLIRPAVYNTNGYFEAAWDTTSPGVPVTGQYNQFTFNDPTSANGTIVQLNSLGNAEMLQNANTSVSVGTAYLHEALQKLQSYQRRHALAGARSIDRVLADYGIQIDYLRAQRSIYVGVSSNDIQINSVFATAAGSSNDSESNVGDYAGAGFGAGSSKIDFQNDEEGIFITIMTIQPSGGYYQGYDRNNRCMSRAEFFQPSFDSLGVQAIEKGEVYVSRDLVNFASDASDYAAAFGFTGRYAEKKRSINRVSGDFSFPRVLAGGSSWHMMRKFNDAYFNNSVTNVVHSEDFCRGTDAEQYLRLFSYTEYEVDPFNVFLHVDCKSYAPCRSLFDTFDWQEETKQVTLDTNGPKLN